MCNKGPGGSSWSSMGTQTSTVGACINTAVGAWTHPAASLSINKAEYPSYIVRALRRPVLFKAPVPLAVRVH